MEFCAPVLNKTGRTHKTDKTSAWIQNTLHLLQIERLAKTHKSAIHAWQPAEAFKEQVQWSNAHATQENPMNNDNADLRKCVKITLYASNSRVIDKQRDLTSKNAWNSRIAFWVNTPNGWIHPSRLGEYTQWRLNAHKRPAKAFSLPTAITTPKNNQNA